MKTLALTISLLILTGLILAVLNYIWLVIAET